MKKLPNILIIAIFVAVFSLSFTAGYMHCHSEYAIPKKLLMDTITESMQIGIEFGKNYHLTTIEQFKIDLDRELERVWNIWQGSDVSKDGKKLKWVKPKKGES